MSANPADPFESGHPPRQSAGAAAGSQQPQQVPAYDINNPTALPDYNYPNSFNAAYSGAAYGGGAPYGSYAGGYGAFTNPYGGGYGTGYNPGYGYNFSYNRQAYPTAGQIASNARETSAMVLSEMHNAMSRFARVSAMIEDVLRNLHMLFDAVFGLGYSLGAFRQEMRLWLAIKTGPVGHIVRFIRRAASVWRLLCLFFMSPLAGRFSPVAFVLRVLGLVPGDDISDTSVLEMWRERERQRGDAAQRGENFIPGESPNL